MPTTSKALIKSETPPPTALMSLKQCSENREAFNALVKLEHRLTIRESITNCPIIATQGKKLEIIVEIIKIIEFFLKTTGKELENFQIQILAGDLYDRFKTDTLEDIVLMFKMARQGDFGKIYSFDTMLVMHWTNLFLEQKAQEREKLVRSQKPEVENEEIGGKYFHELPQELQEKFNELEDFAKDFIPKKASELLDKERFSRSLESEEKKKKPIKFKKFL